MISDDNLSAINNNKLKKCLFESIPFFILIISFFISIFFQFELNENTILFVDKIIDLSSIFFGVFIGCLYLFDKFKTKSTYDSFLKFCKVSISLNIILITFSFVIIVFNEILSDKTFYSGCFLYVFKFKYSIKTIAFSIYFSVFSVSIYYLIRFLRIIFILLK